MNDESSITEWIKGLKAGDSQAAQHLWDRYFDRLLNLARNHLGVVERRLRAVRQIWTVPSGSRW